MSIKCSVYGCNRKLDDNGRPVEYCDHQQGRCPMQKPNISNITLFVLTTAVVSSTIYVLCRVYYMLCPP